MKAAEDLIDSNRIIVVDGEYTDDTIKQAFSEGYEKGYNQAVDDVVNSVKVVNTKKLNFETGKWENIPLIDQTSILKLKK